MCVCSEPCADLLSQVALAPSFTRWELSDIEHFQRLDLASFNQLPHNSQLSVSYFLVFLFLNFLSVWFRAVDWADLCQILSQSNSSMHLNDCIVLCTDISLQRGRFCVRSLALCIPRSSEDRSSWMFFIQVVRGRPGGRLQFSGGGSKMAWLASAFTSIHARYPKKVRRRDLVMDESGGWW